MTRTPRSPRVPRGPRRALRAAGLAASLVLVAGCLTISRAVASFDIAPNGLQSSEDRLRHALARGAYDSALARAGNKELGAPADRLLRSLYGGMIAFYAGDYRRSTSAFERAEEIADERLTRSLSKQAASLVTNDRALPYLPGASERLLTRHYAMLAYLRAGDVGAAAVEARRLVLMLQQQEDAGQTADSATRALLHYVAAATFEMAGERTDAEVAYRNAARFGLAAPAPPAGDSATVLVLVEDGFVAHRVEQSITFAFGSEDEFDAFASDDALEWKSKEQKKYERDRKKREQREADSLLKATREQEGGPPRGGWGFPIPASGSPRGGAPGRSLPPSRGTSGPTPSIPNPADGAATRPRPAPAPEPTRENTAAVPAAGGDTARRPAVAIVGGATPADRLLARVLDRNGDSWYVDDWSRPLDVRSVNDASYVLTFAWPAYARPLPAPRPRAVRVVVDDTARAAAQPVHVADLSASVVADYRRQRAAIFARTLARAATKYYLTKKAEEKKGFWAGMLANAAGDLMERADTRSWHLLPGEISLVRMRVPAGTHALDVQLADPRGGAPRLWLGSVTVKPGETAVVTGRVWNERLAPPLVSDTALRPARARR